MAFRIRDAIVTPNQARDGDELSIDFTARSFSGPQDINARYGIAAEPDVRLEGENPKMFQIDDDTTPCPNTLTLRLDANITPGLYFVVIVARDSFGKTDMTFARLTIL